MPFNPSKIALSRFSVTTLRFAIDKVDSGYPYLGGREENTSVPTFKR